MAMTAEAIIFAINSAIRLGRNAQRAYSKSLTSKSIVLPLPSFSGTPNAFTAQKFFDNDDLAEGGAQYLSKMERLMDIHNRFKTAEGNQFPTDEELEIYIKYYIHLHSLLEQEAKTDFSQGMDDNRITADDVVALLSIRQYTHDSSKHTSPLQMVAGTIVEIGIDYFNRVPGALNEQSASGRTLKHFLKAFDKIPFSDTEKFRQHSRKIVPQLFIAAAETLSEFSSELTHDPKIQAFVQSAGQGIAQDLFNRLDNISDSDHQDEAIKWGRFLLRTTIANAGTYVFQTSDNFFDTKEGTTELIQATSSVLLEVILNDPDKINIKAGMNADTLDSLLQATFSVFAEHPQMIHKENGFKQVVEGVSSALAGYSFKRPDLFPELLRLVIENTGKNLQLFWQKENEDIQAPEDIVLRAVQLILEELSQPIEGEEWRPHLSKTQLLFITEELLDEVVSNPAWMEEEVNEKPLLSAVIRATIQGLANIPRHERFSVDTFHWLIQLNLRTIASNHNVLNKIKWSDNDTEEIVLHQALDLVFTYVFDPKATTAGDRYELLADMLDYVLEVIISRHPDEKGLQLLDLILFESEGIDYRGGFSRDLANAMIDAALDVLNTHPELISEKAALSAVVAGVAGSLNASSFKESDILVELVRLTLENTALNAALVLDAESGEERYLLVVFVRELLLALSYKDEDGNVWQPDLTPEEALVIVDNLVLQLIEHPEWIVDGPDGQIIFRDVLTAVRIALRDIPAGVKLSTEQLQLLIALAFKTAVMSEAVLDKIPWGTDVEKRTVMERALSITGNYIFREMRNSNANLLEEFMDLVDYVMQTILVHHPGKKGLMLLQLVLFGADDIDYSRGFNQDLADDIIDAALSVVEQQPELFTGEEALQNIIQSLTASLSASDFREPGILPELVRMVLESTALNAQLIVKAESGEARFLLVIALQDLLTQLSAKDADGSWHPTLTGEDLLLLSETLLEQVVQHPNWLIKDGEEASVWNDVVASVLDALSGLPEGTRLDPEVLEQLILISLYTAANSPSLLEKIKWADNDTEKGVLNAALDLLVAYVYPPASEPSAYRLEIFLEILDFTMEAVLTKYPDKRSLIILDLLFFKSSVDLNKGFNQELAEDLIDAALDILETHPQLVTNEVIFRKILSDTARSLRAAKVPVDHLLPEFFRLILFFASGNLENLMRISPNSPRILLVVALEQTLRVITQPPTRGKWRPSFTDEQLLELVEVVLEQVVANPDWVGNEKLIQLTLEAIYTSIGELKRGQSIPYETIGLLIEAGMDAVGQRRQLVLNFVTSDGGKEQIVLEYALGNLMVKLYDEEGDTAGAWTLTQAETLHTILTHYLLRLAIGPADKETVDEIQAPINNALQQINDNLAFTLDELLLAIDEA